ncbi:MAG: formimidoylglutamate deiminase [Arthrobacter sp.]|uniref:formimidoylglutamate deiminase n=1 Tax=unclassified Arthrobacter TaxID=235627 RepID=UPI00264DD9EA|nr:formimidoylglutamate deiminase [Micrococcaceae bacterium]MDN5824127.1 formimidoylglutamate deiminase [Micrococcaceae bacterium]MDN5879267.1 formimidoylglutamate deiminase [Micrococcaceae bacterium]MDN5886023.1 formimidoylglutamate deiminase [Micrococcaceae bacterium]MDN5905404.1 formimidoylglutamate deiminase [Micrococcaceae bacterium]
MSGAAEDLVKVPGPVNAHSHAFHRILRGRTHEGATGGAGDFWTWRERMYAAADQLDPAGYEQLATAVFAEMVVSGFTAVGEFHYLHHGPDGTPYPDHDMERALARAARAAGIRLVLLDTCYLSGGLDAEGAPVELNATQRRFSDGDAAGWVGRHAALRAALASEEPATGADGAGLVTLGAALHSVRAVPLQALPVIAAALEPGEPLHVHLSEQPAENQGCLAAHGVSPTALLAGQGLLGPRLSAVHATHLTEADIAALGAAGCSIVMCPTTEADLADGIGPARALVDAGANLALGTDQHAVIDPYLEMRALEYGERLRSGIRGRFAPAELSAASRAGGLRSLSLPGNDDHLLVDAGSLRTAGSRVAQLPLTATAADVHAVVINGVEVAREGIHTRLGDPAALLRTFIYEHREFA